MWWCCGKQTKDALGCKFQKHVEKRDDDDQDDLQKLLQDQPVKNQLCLCCKDKGHPASECPKDPNLRTYTSKHTLYLLDQDEDRVLTLGQLMKKMAALNQVQTTHLVKRVIQAVNEDDVEIGENGE